jgi:hypothetical protein
VDARVARGVGSIRMVGRLSFPLARSAGGSTHCQWMPIATVPGSSPERTGRVPAAPPAESTADRYGAIVDKEHPHAQ